MVRSSFGFILRSRYDRVRRRPSSSIREDGSSDETLLRRVRIAATVCSNGRLRAAVVLLHALMLGRREGVFGLAHFVWRAVCDHDELTGFDLRLVFDDAVFGKPDAAPTHCDRLRSRTYR